MWLIIIYNTNCMLPVFVADSTCLSQRRHNLHTPGLDINHKSQIKLSSSLHTYEILGGHQPGLSSAELGPEHRVHDGGPEHLHGEGVGGDGEGGLVGVGDAAPGQDQGDGGLEAEGYTLQAVEEQQDADVQLVTLHMYYLSLIPVDNG